MTEPQRAVLSGQRFASLNRPSGGAVVWTAVRVRSGCDPSSKEVSFGRLVRLGHDYAVEIARVGAADLATACEEGSIASADDIVLDRPEGCCGAGRDADLGVDVLDVVVCGLR
jgi:hypothetical protein